MILYVHLGVFLASSYHIINNSQKQPTSTHTLPRFQRRKQVGVVGGDKQTLQQTYSPKEVQGAFKVLMTHWFCNSHYVSHFAAFFIDMGAKTSIAESVLFIIVISHAIFLVEIRDRIFMKSTSYNNSSLNVI